MTTTTTATIEPQSVAELLAKDSEVWRGPSGEFVTGASVALHLEATAALLKRVGWVRNYTATDTPDATEAPGDSSTMRDMLRWIVRILRTELDGVDDKRRTLCLALSDIANSDTGDDDTRSAAEKVLTVVLRSRTGASYVVISSWASRLDRTWPQVRGLLAEAADAAREFGPADDITETATNEER